MCPRIPSPCPGEKSWVPVRRASRFLVQSRLVGRLRWTERQSEARKHACEILGFDSSWRAPGRNYNARGCRRTPEKQLPRFARNDTIWDSESHVGAVGSIEGCTELAFGQSGGYPPRSKRSLLLWRGFFVGVVGHVAEDTFAFLDVDHLIGLDVFESVDGAARPLDFEEIDFFGFADAEVHAQIALREIAATAPHFIDLRMRLAFPGNLRHATQASANAAAIGFCADGAHLDPVVLQR